MPEDDVALRLTASGPGSRTELVRYVATVLQQRTTPGEDTSARRLAEAVVTSILHRLGAGLTAAAASGPDIEALIEASSLGTAGAKALRERTSAQTAAAVVARSAMVARSREFAAPEGDDVRELLDEGDDALGFGGPGGRMLRISAVPGGVGIRVRDKAGVEAFVAIPMDLCSQVIAGTAGVWYRQRLRYERQPAAGPVAEQPGEQPGGQPGEQVR
jgi:hypothetical protein